MNITINSLKDAVQIWLKQHPKIQQWLWFVILWVSGLLAVTILTYPLKWLMRH